MSTAAAYGRHPPMILLSCYRIIRQRETTKRPVSRVATDDTWKHLSAATPGNSRRSFLFRVALRRTPLMNSNRYPSLRGKRATSKSTSSSGCLRLRRRSAREISARVRSEAADYKSDADKQTRGLRRDLRCLAAMRKDRVPQHSKCTESGLSSELKGIQIKISRQKSARGAS